MTVNDIAAEASRADWNATTVASIIVAGITVLGGIIGGWQALKGRQEEAATTALRDLLAGLGEFNESLESRVKTLEDHNEIIMRKLRVEEDRSQVLRLALRRAIESIRGLVEWTNGPRATPPPRVPLDAFEAILAETEVPTARLPPSTG